MSKHLKSGNNKKHFTLRPTHFMGGLSIYMLFTSSSLIVSNFALCGMPFLTRFYSRDFILEMFSMRYVNIFGFFLLFVSNGLTVCYSFRLFYFVLCG